MQRGNPLRDISALPARRRLATETTEGPTCARKITGRADPAVAQRYWWHDASVVAEQDAHSCDAYEALEHQAEPSSER